jgi:hypothetical protein
LTTVGAVLAMSAAFITFIAFITGAELSAGTSATALALLADSDWPALQTFGAMA